MPKLPKRAEKAINELAWQGANQFAIKVCDLPLQATARDAMTFPAWWAMRGPAYWPYLKFFSQSRTPTKPRDPIGGYRNKTAVVYAISVLETYLKSVYKHRGWAPSGSTFGSYFYNVKGRGRKLRFKDRAAIDGVEFLLEIRNAIIHSFGVLDEARKERMRPLRDFGIWPDDPKPDEPIFDDDFRAGPRGVLCLDIIKVVIPGLKRSIEYVIEIERALRRKRR